MASRSLSYAVVDGDKKEVAKLLSKRPQEVHLQDAMGFTPLHWAADQGHAEIVRMLVDAGASANVQDVDGYIPLHFVCSKAHVECARILIPISDLGLVDFKLGWTVLMHAESVVRMAYDSEDGDHLKACQLICDLVSSEPSRVDFEALQTSAGPGVDSVSSKLRI